MRDDTTMLRFLVQLERRASALGGVLVWGSVILLAIVVEVCRSTGASS